MTSSSTPAHPPAAPPTQERSRLTTDRWILWAGILSTAALTGIRSVEQLLHRVESDVAVKELTSGLDDPALAQLSVRVGVALAVALSVGFLILYLLLCTTVDERLLPGTMVPTRRPRHAWSRSPGIGPAVLVGMGSTIPVHVVALLLGVSAPKESPLLFAWLAVLVIAVYFWTTRTASTRPLSLGRGASILAILAALAALSLLF